MSDSDPSSVQSATGRYVARRTDAACATCAVREQAASQARGAATLSGEPAAHGHRSRRASTVAQRSGEARPVCAVCESARARTASVPKRDVRDPEGRGHGTANAAAVAAGTACLRHAARGSARSPARSARAGSGRREVPSCPMPHPAAVRWPVPGSSSIPDASAACRRACRGDRASRRSAGCSRRARSPITASWRAVCGVRLAAPRTGCKLLATGYWIWRC